MANFKFKINTNVLADKLVKITTNIISPNFRGFIQDRQISDGIRLKYEAIYKIYTQIKLKRQS